MTLRSQVRDGPIDSETIRARRLAELHAEPVPPSDEAEFAEDSMRRAFGRAGYGYLDGTTAVGLKGVREQDTSDVRRRGHERAYPDGSLVGAADEVAVYPPRGIPGDQSPAGMQVEGSPDQGGTIPAEGPAIRTV